MRYAQLKKNLKQSEGLKTKLYKDSLGFWTIGYGRLLDPDKGGQITPAEAEYLLDNDIAAKVEELTKKAQWVFQLDEVRRDVLIDMAFNLGVDGLLKWTNTMADIKAGRYKDAAEKMAGSLWAKQVKSRAVRLCKEMETGKYQD